MINYKKFLIFIIVGAITAMIDIGLMQLLIYFEIHYIAAATIGFFIGLLANFFLHTHVTFRAELSIKVVYRFATVVLINYLGTMFIIHIFQIILSQPLLGKFISLPLVAMNGFLLSKNWVYK